MRIVFCSALWCSPCQILKPIFKEVAALNPDVSVSYVNMDEESSLEFAEKYSVRAVPTILVLDGDREVRRVVGNVSREILESLFREI